MSASLDWALSSTYNQSVEVFPNKTDVVFQRKTLITDLVINRERRILQQLFRAQDRKHPLVYGGIKEKKHPSTIRTGISSFHTPQTNAGFARKIDGSFFGV